MTTTGENANTLVAVKEETKSPTIWEKNSRDAWGSRLAWARYDWIIPYSFDLSMAKCIELARLPAGGRVVDIGCGNGRSLMQLSTWLKGGGHLTGIDMQLISTEFAQRRAESLGIADRVEFHVGDMCDLSAFEAATFDAAILHFSVYTLGSASSRRAAIAEAARLVVPGGRVSCAVPGQEYRADKLVAYSKPLEMKRPGASIFYRLMRRYVSCPLLLYMNKTRLDRRLDKEIFHRYADGELEADFAAAGLSNIDVRVSTGFSAYHAVGIRP